MNIGSMLRAWLGETTPANRKVLELRIGQIVRGVLVEMLENREALMNINGVSVRAKLETDLPVGQGALLQVQPGSNSNAIVLKPLAGASDLAPDEALRNVLKQFGLPDQKWSYELLRGLRRDGYSLDGGTASAFREAASIKPAAVDMASWMSTADVAFRRGLPLTESTLAALRQALYGPPLHEELTNFAQLFRQSSPSGAGSSAPWAASLQQLLQQGDQLLALGRASLAGEAAPPAAAPSAAALQAAAMSGGQAVQADIGQSAVHRQDVQVAMRAEAMPTPASGAASSSLQPAASGDGRGQAAMAADARPQLSATAIAASTDGAAAARAAQQVTVRETPVVTQPSVAMQPEPAAAAPSGNAATSWLGRFLQWLGVGHENQLLQTMTDARPLPEQAASPSASAAGALPETQRQAVETLKSALLSLIAHEEAPQALREAAQSLVNHITGQQLLLSSERQFNQPYSFMTLFIPMKGQDGDTTATVHVQTRRSRKGEWDADNCRLLFDLRMRYLGNTVVDVQVVDRIVSVKLMNDFPGMTDMAENAREELTEGLREIGFQLLALHVQPLPVSSVAEQDEPGEAQPSWQPSDYSAKPYKGVDYRI